MGRIALLDVWRDEDEPRDEGSSIIAGPVVEKPTDDGEEGSP